MDDDFRDALEELSTERLTEMAGNKRALDKFRPVGVSHSEAMAMIAYILEVRANPPPPPEPTPEPTPEPEPSSAEVELNLGHTDDTDAPPSGATDEHGYEPLLVTDDAPRPADDPHPCPSVAAERHPSSSVSEPPAATELQPPARSLALPLTLAGLIAAALLFSALL